MLEGRFPAKKWKSYYIIETIINKTIIRLVVMKPAHRMIRMPVFEIFVKMLHLMRNFCSILLLSLPS